MFTEKEIERMLEVILTDEEIAKRSREMSKVVISRGNLKAQAKIAAEGFAAEIKLLDQKIESEASAIEHGKEIRKVICKEVLNTEEENEAIIIRTDTGEIIASRPLTEEEKQQNLFDDTAAETITFSHLDKNGDTIEIITTTPEQLSKAANDKWSNFLDDVEAELEADEAAKPEWEKRELTLADYEAYAASTGVKYPKKEAKRWFESGQLAASVRVFLENQAEKNKDNDEADMERWLEPVKKEEPTQKPRRSKIKLHDEASYQEGL